MVNKIINIARVKCDRCGKQREIELKPSNKNKAFTNEISIYAIDFEGQQVEDYSHIRRRICNNCWSDLIDFLNPIERGGGER